MLHHTFPYERCLESMIEYLEQLTTTINNHTTMLYHYIRETLHIKSGVQAISYISKHPDEEFQKYLQSIYNFNQNDIFSFHDHSNEISAQESDTSQQLIEMSPETFEIVVDCFAGQIPQSPMVNLISSLAVENKLSDVKVRYVEERMPVELAVARSKSINDKYGGIDDEYVNQLLRWTHKSQAEVIYHSDQYGRDVSVFNSTICGRSNFAIFVISGGIEVFGSYHGKSLISPPKNRWDSVVNDEKFFVFSCKNAFNTQMIQFHPQQPNTSSLILFPCRDITNLYHINNCYQVGQFESVVVKKKEFAKHFKNVPVASTELFCGIKGDKFVANKIIVLQLK